MTPTEQDKELFENSFGEWLENHGVELSGNNPSHLGTWQTMVDMNELKLAIMQLITADRRRVALEAELQLLTYLLDERTEHMFMQNPDTGEMTGDGWLCNTSLSAVSANRIEAERRKRIAELKEGE